MMARQPRLPTSRNRHVAAEKPALRSLRGAKRNKIAALAALMRARGMFSRDHILLSPPIETLIKKTFAPVRVRQLGKNIFWNG
jgi:hypothetical protein